MWAPNIKLGFAGWRIRGLGGLQWLLYLLEPDSKMLESKIDLVSFCLDLS